MTQESFTTLTKYILLGFCQVAFLCLPTVEKKYQLNVTQHSITFSILGDEPFHVCELGEKISAASLVLCHIISAV